MLRLKTGQSYILQLEEIATQFIENKVIPLRNENNQIKNEFQQVCNKNEQNFYTKFKPIPKNC